jgi:hypothetical protein
VFIPSLCSALDVDALIQQTKYRHVATDASPGKWASLFRAEVSEQPSKTLSRSRSQFTRKADRQTLEAVAPGYSPPSPDPLFPHVGQSDHALVCYLSLSSFLCPAAACISVTGTVRETQAIVGPCRSTLQPLLTLRSFSTCLKIQASCALHMQHLASREFTGGPPTRFRQVAQQKSHNR